MFKEIEDGPITIDTLFDCINKEIKKSSKRITPETEFILFHRKNNCYELQLVLTNCKKLIAIVYQIAPEQIKMVKQRIQDMGYEIEVIDAT